MASSFPAHANRLRFNRMITESFLPLLVAEDLPPPASLHLALTSKSLRHHPNTFNYPSQQ